MKNLPEFQKMKLMTRRFDEIFRLWFPAIMFLAEIAASATGVATIRFFPGNPEKYWLAPIMYLNSIQVNIFINIFAAQVSIQSLKWLAALQTEMPKLFKAEKTTTKSQTAFGIRIGNLKFVRRNYVLNYLDSHLNHIVSFLLV